MSIICPPLAAPSGLSGALVGLPRPQPYRLPLRPYLLQSLLGLQDVPLHLVGIGLHAGDEQGQLLGGSPGVPVGEDRAGVVGKEPSVPLPCPAPQLLSRPGREASRTWGALVSLCRGALVSLCRGRDTRP